MGGPRGVSAGDRVGLALETEGDWRGGPRGVGAGDRGGLARGTEGIVYATMPRMDAITAPDSLYKLVADFQRGEGRFLRADYKESQLRQEFVNPFFAALGWDVGNSRQVLHEASLRSGRSVKHPDYSFLAGARRVFYVETKKPAIDIGASFDPALQLRSYGWSGNTAVGILTNFAEFAVYDCRIQPQQGDSPATARLLHLDYGQYLDEWALLHSAFSRQAVQQGKHRDLLEAAPKNVLPVDEAFLQDMEHWRRELARELHKQARFIDRELSERDLNLLVQQTIDRIVFLRIAEDRSLEPESQLERAAQGQGVYKKLKDIYVEADRKYNSGLFHFDAADDSRPNPDKLSMEIYIPDSILRPIILDLYPPKSRYQFSVIAADILGQAYERFLGNVIEVRSDKYETTVAVREKPQVRKAGGVFYTPSYIVDYIVENTVGALLDGATPQQAETLRILDPACGSGSFLTGAYQYLLDWHLRQYARQPERYKNRISRRGDGYILNLVEKRRILTSNMFGVDLDQNAVEVSKLSLLLKMLEHEDENGGALDADGPLLPDLSGNIKWGNSLVGSDFYQGQRMDDMDDQDQEEMRRVKVFDWESAAGFGEIMAAGGFDAVIGNPPYGADLEESVDSYLRAEYGVAEYQLDTYSLFIEKAFRLAKSQGLCGYIIPTAWVASQYDRELRRFLVSNAYIRKVVIAPKRVFKDASVETAILVYGKRATGQESFEVERWDIEPRETYGVSVVQLKQDKEHIFRVYSRPKVTDLIHRLKASCVPISDHGKVVWGVKVYERGKGIPPQTGEESRSKAFHSAEKIKDTQLPLLGGREILRYGLKWRGGYIDYGKWLAAPRTPDWFEGERILIREVTSKGQIQATVVDDQFVFSNSVDGVKITSSVYSAKFVLGILNSKLVSFYHLNSSPNAFKGAFPKLLLKDIRGLPLPRIHEKSMHDEMVGLVETMLDLHAQRPRLSGEARRVVELRIESTDKAIDALVYRLYGLSQDEIELING